MESGLFPAEERSGAGKEETAVLRKDILIF